VLSVGVALIATCALAACNADPGPAEQANAADASAAPNAMSSPRGKAGAAPTNPQNASPDAGGAVAMPGLPAGHPVIETTSPTAAFPPVDPESGTGENALGWTVPEGWIAQPPANEMRRAQYLVPGEAGDAECVVFYFGAGRGGEPMRNAERWAAQFIQPDGTDPVEAMRTETIQVGGTPVLLVETSGTYGVDPMAGGTGRPMAQYMLLGAIAEGPDANWFFKFTGPEETVQANASAFHEMIRSLEPGAR